MDASHRTSSGVNTQMLTKSKEVSRDSQSTPVSEKPYSELFFFWRASQNTFCLCNRHSSSWRFECTCYQVRERLKRNSLPSFMMVIYSVLMHILNIPGNSSATVSSDECGLQSTSWLILTLQRLRRICPLTGHFCGVRETHVILIFGSMTSTFFDEMMGQIIIRTWWVIYDTCCNICT